MANDKLTVKRTGSGGDFPLEGVVDSNSAYAKLKTVDSGIENFPKLEHPDGVNDYGFVPLTIGTTTRSLDDFYSDAYASGTNNAIIPIVAQRSITLSAPSGNTAAVRVGNSKTSTTVGFPIAAGGTLTLELTRGSSIYLCAASGSQTIDWIAV
jgi:hypothetical protein